MTGDLQASGGDKYHIYYSLIQNLTDIKKPILILRYCYSKKYYSYWVYNY